MIVWSFVLAQVSKFKVRITAAGIIFIWFLNEMRKSKNQGRQEVLDKIKEKQDALEKKWQTSIIVLCLSMTLLSGCVWTRITPSRCPQIQSIPPSVEKVLETLKGNPEAEQWIVGLAKTKEKL